MASATDTAGQPLPLAIAPPVDRVSHLFVDHFELVWRTLRRLGVHPESIDDAVQEVFIVATRKIDIIEAGREKAFLYGTAVRVAADARRASKRSRVTPVDSPDAVDIAPAPDELLDQRRARDLLDAIVAVLPEDVQPVFILFELEGLTLAEIAGVLELPAGTVASRLRRAREVFEARVRRLAAKEVR